MYKRARDKPHENEDNLSTIQQLAWGAHDKIFGMAGDVKKEKARNPAHHDDFGLAADIGN